MSSIHSNFFAISREAANLAKECRRDETSQNAFLDALIRLDGLPTSSGASDKPVIEAYQRKCNLASERLLELAIKRLNQVCRGDIDQICRALQIHAIEAGSDILPSGDGEVQMALDETSHEFGPTKQHERFQILVRTLLESGIYSDDLVVIKGKVPEGRFRKSPYYLIEVPIKDLQFMVCQETNQASFIMRGMISREELFSLDKDTLMAKYPNEITRLFWRGEDNYREAILNALNNETKPKINIKERETFVKLIKDRFTVSQWVKMTKREAEALVFDNRALPAIARIVFGMSNFKITNTDDRLRLGALIYGSSDSDIRQAQEDRVGLKKLQEDKNYAIQCLKDRVIDLKAWGMLTIAERRAIKIHGVGMKIIGKIILDRDFKPDNPNEWTLLGQSVFGTSEEQRLSHGQLIQALREKGVVYIQDRIKESFPDSQSFIAIPTRTIMAINIDGVAITAIAKILGIEDFKHSSKDHSINFGFAIYGNDDLLLKEFRTVYDSLKDKEKLKSLLLERIPATEWISMDKKAIQDYRLADISLLTVYNILFDVEKSDSSLTNEKFRLMGNLVHGEESLTQLKASLAEQIRQEYKSSIIENFPTATNLLELPLRALRSGTIKLIEGDIGNDKVISCFITNYRSPLQIEHLVSLAKILYPEELKYIEEFEQQIQYQKNLQSDKKFLIEELRSIVGNDRENWDNQNYSFKKSFKLGSLGITTLHSMLGFSQEANIETMWLNITNAIFNSAKIND